MNIRPLKGPNGEITGAINCFYDITERHRLERARQQQAEALADLNRRKDEFLAVVSHELRNPLASIANAAHLLRSNDDVAPLLQERARSIIERQVQQLTRLVDDLMDVSRVSTGMVRLQLDDVAVSGVVERAVDVARHLINQQGHELTVSLPPIPMRALTIQGSYVGSLPEMKELIELVRRTGIPPVPVATRPLEDVNAVMDQLRAGKVIGRVVLTPN